MCGWKLLPFDIAFKNLLDIVRLIMLIYYDSEYF